MALKLWPRLRPECMSWEVFWRPVPLLLVLWMWIAEVAREDGGRELGREVEVVKLVCQVSLVQVLDSARRREVERPLRKDCADWSDFAS